MLGGESLAAHDGLKRLRHTQLLWVDDSPRGNVRERRLLRDFGVFVDLAKSNDEAIDRFLETPYDVVISNINRGREKAVSRYQLG